MATASKRLRDIKVLTLDGDDAPKPSSIGEGL